ncbi:hypothetical protein PO909_008444 [Leuciscus waleckii]
MRRLDTGRRMRTHKPGTEIFAGKPKTKVPSRQPYPLTWLILWVWTAMTVSLPFATIDGPLDVSVSQVPGFLTQPVVYCGDISGLTGPRKQGWLETEDALKRSQACGVLTNGILSILCPHKVPAPVPLMELAVGPEEARDLLIEAFDLTISLRMVAGGEAHVNLQLLEECSPNTRGELGSPVRDDVLG